MSELWCVGTIVPQDGMRFGTVGCAAFAAAHGLSDPSTAAMSAKPQVPEEVSAGVERANRHLSRVEQIKRFKVLGVDWLPSGDELTPTMKLRRRSVADNYSREIEALYERE